MMIQPVSDFVVTESVFTKPEKVETFTISDNTTTSVVLRWLDIPSATGYIIYRAGTGGISKRLELLLQGSIRIQS